MSGRWVLGVATGVSWKRTGFETQKVFQGKDREE